VVEAFFFIHNQLPHGCKNLLKRAAFFVTILFFFSAKLNGRPIPQVWAIDFTPPPEEYFRIQ